MERTCKRHVLRVSWRARPGSRPISRTAPGPRAAWRRTLRQQRRIPSESPRAIPRPWRGYV